MYNELELVNHILATLGESTTPTLQTTHPAVQHARSILMDYNKEFQGIGWWFNQEFGVKLLPDANGRVLVPQNSLQFRVTKSILDCSGSPAKARFVKRGKYVYDTVKHTDILDCAIWCDVTTLLDYDDLPQSAGAYLKHWSAESAFLADDGDAQVYRLLQQKTALAFARLQQDSNRTRAPNALQSPHAARLRGSWARGSAGTRNENFIGG